MEGWINSLIESMYRYIGQTVTIFTTSGGLSGCGFTGVLISVDCNAVRLLANMGAAPSCPVGSNCGGCCNNDCDNNSCGCFNPLGAITVIPTCSIASFTHNAI